MFLTTKKKINLSLSHEKQQHKTSKSRKKKLTIMSKTRTIKITTFNLEDRAKSKKKIQLSHIHN